MQAYKTIYSDKFGEENTIIYTDGTTLFLTLRGIKFEGSDFELLEGKIDESKFDYEKYKDCSTGDVVSGNLTKFKLTSTIPIKITWNDKETEVNIQAQIETGDDSIVYLNIDTKFGSFSNTKNYGWFEDALLDIKNQFPKNAKIKTCISCKFSNYHPVGNGMFGALRCFKNMKDEASKITNKTELFIMWDKGIKEKSIFNVQETFECTDHQFLSLKDWTYKSWIE